MSPVPDSPVKHPATDTERWATHSHGNNRAVRRGDVFVNDVTGERAVVLLGPCESPDARLVAHVTIAPAGAVNGAHHHPSIEERFCVLSGDVGFRVGDCRQVARTGANVLVALASEFRDTVVFASPPLIATVIGALASSGAA